MPITRTTLLAGPAAATFNGHTIFANDGILVTPALELDEVESDANSVLDETVVQVPVTIKFTPSAPFADLIALYPWTSGLPGASLFGSADTPLVLTAANGVRVTFSSVAIIGMPDLLLTSRGPVNGAVTFLALGARSMAMTAANRFVTIDTASIPLPPLGTPQLADDFRVNWGGAPWVNLGTRDGVRIKFSLRLKQVLSDANALLDLTLDRLMVEVRFTPAAPSGPTESDLFDALELQVAKALPGRALSSTAQTLKIAGEHLVVELPSAQLVGGELAFDAVRGRVGELRFKAERAFLGTGAAEPLVSLSEGRP